MPTRVVDLTDARDSALAFKATQRGTTPELLLSDVVAYAVDPWQAEERAAMVAVVADAVGNLPTDQQADLGANVKALQDQLATRREAEQVAEVAAKARARAEQDATAVAVSAGDDLAKALALKQAFDKADATTTKAEIAAAVQLAAVAADVGAKRAWEAPAPRD